MKMTGFAISWSIITLLAPTSAQLYPNPPFGGDTPYSKDNDERINQILMKTLALEEEFGRLRTTVEDMDKRVDILYHGDAEWGQWSAFSSCSQTCTPADGSTGIQTRTRSCVIKVPPLLQSDAMCEGGEGVETRNCSANRPCPAIAARPNPPEYVGGDGGRTFSDVSDWNGQNITALRLNCDDLLNSIQVKYGNNWGNPHGRDFKSCRNDGTDYSYTFDSTEFINKVQFRYGDVLDAITITTNKRTLPKCGGSGGSRKTVNGTRLLYISGRKGCVIDGIKLHWAE